MTDRRKHMATMRKRQLALYRQIAQRPTAMQWLLSVVDGERVYSLPRIRLAESLLDLLVADGAAEILERGIRVRADNHAGGRQAGIREYVSRQSSLGTAMRECG